VNDNRLSQLSHRFHSGQKENTPTSSAFGGNTARDYENRWQEVCVRQTVRELSGTDGEILSARNKEVRCDLST
jgi:hypothetical protein